MFIELEKNTNNFNLWKILKSAAEVISESKLPPRIKQQWLTEYFQSLHSIKEKTLNKSILQVIY